MKELDKTTNYFEQSLQNFTREFAYGGAIRHLVDRGYTADRIIKEFHYPLSRETIEKMVKDYEKENQLKVNGDTKE